MSKETDDLFDDEVTTGATLASGTTIAGNTAFHLGNDGQGSGLDAETVDGSEPVQKGVKYGTSPSTGPLGDEISNFSSPSSGARDLGVDSNDCIWHCDFRGGGYVYKYDRGGSELSKLSSPSSNPTGVDENSSGSLWIADSDVDSIYLTNKSISVQKKFSSPSNQPTGTGVDSNDSIWQSIDTGIIYKLDESGTVLTSFDLQRQSKGVGFDNQGSIWNTDYFESVFKLNQSGSVIEKFNTNPYGNTYGAGIDSNGCLWVSHYNDDRIVEYTTGRDYNTLTKL